MKPAHSPDAALHRNLRLFVTGICVAILAMFAVMTIHARDVALSVAEREMLNLAESLVAEESNSFEFADRSLLDIAERVRLHGIGPEAAAELVHSMTLSLRSIPRLRLLRIINPAGHIAIDNTSPHGHPRVSLADRDYFIYHRTHDSTQAIVSGPFLSRTEHLWVVTVSRRINDRAGRFAGVAEALIARSYFQDRYANVDLGPQGLRGLFRDDGTGKVIVGPRGIDMAPSWPQAPWFNGPLGQMRAASFLDMQPFDHSWRVAAFSRSRRYKLLQAVATGADDVLVAWRRDAIINFAIAALVVLLFVALESVLSHQIERRRAAESARARLALFDPLTGLANRRQFDTFFARAWLAAARRRRTPLAMLMIDPDNFRHCIESHGQPAANEVLRAIAGVIQESIRPTDLAAADGGETFAVVLPSTDRAGAYALAEQIRRAVMLSSAHRPVAGGCVTVSIGVAAMTPTVSGEPGLLLVAADRALFEAKSAGHNRSVVSTQANVTISAPGHDKPNLETPVLSALIGLSAADEDDVREANVS